MNMISRLRANGRLVSGIILATSVLLIAACQPIVDPAELEARSAASLEALVEVEPAMATIDARTLRVHEGPSDDYELIAGVKEGESYSVLSMTDDGAWIQLEIEDAPDGQGWVSTEFVTLEGDITNIATVPAEESESTAAAESSAATNLSAIGEALIQTSLPLRVRSEPTDAVDNKIGSVYNLERYPVLDVSEDGRWILIDVPQLSDTGGWVWWENVKLEGEVADQLALAAEETGEDAAASESAEADAGTEAEAQAEPVAEADAGTEAGAQAEPVAEADAGTEAGAQAEPVAEADAGAETQPPAEAETSSQTEAAPAAEVAVSAVQALIDTPLPLRVRSAPTDAVDNKIGSVYNLEEYPVLAISEDGLWIKIDVPKLSDSGGWVWWENVKLEGEIPEELLSATEDTEGESTVTEEPAPAEPAEAAGSTEMAEAEGGEATSEATSEDQIVSAAEAVIVAPLPLRVRSEPTDAVDNKIGNVFDGESYPVLEVSEDGLWVKIFVPELSEVGGWVSAEYVSMVEQ